MSRKDAVFGLLRSRTMEDVAQYIKEMRFRKKAFGGVDEADVWLKIELLHKEYESVFMAQEIRHEEELRAAKAGKAKAFDKT